MLLHTGPGLSTLDRESQRCETNETYVVVKKHCETKKREAYLFFVGGRPCVHFILILRLQPFALARVDVKSASERRVILTGRLAREMRKKKKEEEMSNKTNMVRNMPQVVEAVPDGVWKEVKKAKKTTEVDEEKRDV